MDKLADLREAMEKQGLTALLLPRTNKFQSTHLPPSAEELLWLTGFTGSAGFLILTQEKAIFFTDARYLLQAKKELSSAYEIFNIFSTSPAQWIAENLRDQEKIGYDPWMFTEAQLQAYTHPLTPLAFNPIDSLWKERPEEDVTPIVLHSLDYAGESSLSKRIRIAKTLHTDHVLLTSPESIAWLLNIRGNDVPCSPLVNCMCILHTDGSFDLCVDQRKVTEEVAAYIQKEGGKISDFKEIVPLLKALSGSCQIDPQKAPFVLVEALEEAGVTLQRQRDPCLVLKALKNSTELKGSQNAHVQDGLALCRFFAWLHTQPLAGETTELSAAQKLYEFRQSGQDFKGPSFETISAFGSHGAIIHYHPSPSSDRPITRNGLYLLDSGGQYLSGTTDVTRTLALGIPSQEEKENYTRVLKGHIALARAIFPAGTTGAQLDSLARQFLWAVGKDYSHGTGHGVGSYLSVHEGPQNISPRGGDPLHPGMILSNEPGYYKEGHYGIRIESLVHVTETKAFKGFYCFETLTLVPFDRPLIESTLLTAEEKEWINQYHTRILKILSPHLDSHEKEWLAHASRPL